MLRQMDHAIATRTNTAIIATVTVAQLFVFTALPLLLMQSMWWVLLLAPLALLNIPHWGLIHEAIHKLLHPDPEANEHGGRLLSILMGPSFHVLRFGHLMHHKLNRDWHSELVEHPTLGARIYYYCNLTFGLYAGELIPSLMFTFLPRKQFMRIANATFLKGYPEVAVAGERFFFDRGNVVKVRTDMTLSIALFSLALWNYGTLWPALLAFVVLRAFVISFMDNIYHYATPADNSKAGKELILPAGVSRALLHSNYHETHHLNPDVPWVALPKVHQQQGRVFDGDFISHGVMQLAGPAVI